MIVVDASIVYKWFSLSEKFAQKAQELLILAKRTQENIAVPDFLYIELANVWATKLSLPRDEIRRNMKLLFDIELQAHHVTSEVIYQAIDFSTHYKVSVYDSLYAVLAKELSCDLITADEKFVRQTNLSYIKLLNS